MPAFPGKSAYETKLFTLNRYCYRQPMRERHQPMAYYQYVARDARGSLHQGVLEVPDVKDAARRLKADGLYPVKIKAVRSRRPRRVPEQQVIGFFKDLSDLLLAGVPLDNALALISTSQGHKLFQQVVQDVLSSVQGGKDLSDAIGGYQDVFGVLSGYMIRAGEASGTLPMILGNLGEYLERRREFRRNALSALIYPCILMAVSGVSIFILLIYVIPKFAQIFQDLNQKVPFLTQLLLDAGVFLQSYGWTIPVSLLGLYLLARSLYRQPKVKRAVHTLQLRLPFSRYLVLHAELTRFCRTLGTMLVAGVPLIRALSLVEELILNQALREILAPLQKEIRIGNAASSFFRARKIFPPRMATMLRIAEEQGALGERLLELGDYFEKELQQTVRKLMTLMEPAVIVVAGGVIAVMVMSMFTAIFGITDIQF